MANPSGFFEGTEMPVAGWWEALFSDPAAIVRRLGVSPGLSVIDLCSGDGWFTLQIAKTAARVWAVDIDPALHRISKARLAEAGIDNTAHITGSAYDIESLVTERVDLVFMANCFHGVPDGPQLAKVVAGSLNDRGRFSIMNWHKRARDDTPVLGEPRGPRTDLRLSPEETTTAVEAGGLRLIEIAEIPPYHYGAVFERSA